MSLQFKEAIEFMRRRLEMPDSIWEALIQEADIAARSRARDMSEAMFRDVLEAVLHSLENGETVNAFQDSFEDIVKRHGWAGEDGAGYRSSLLFRNLTAQAQAAGRWRQVERNLGRPNRYLRYVTVGDRRVRPAHAAWHNVVLPIDHPWWNTHFPPNGHNCRCHVVQLDAIGLELYGLEVTDPPPAMNMVEKIIKRDGEYVRVEVPAGIDPGFAFNPGKIGLQLPPKP